MSDTPKTDELAKREFVTDGVWIRHARELERENASLRATAVSEILAPDHRGMRVNGFRYLQQAHGTGFTFMRREMARHLEEMGRRYYAGDVTAVDEFLQLYCIAESERASVVAERARKEAQP